MFASTRAFLFDFDGTLIHQTIDFARMRADALAVAAHYGVDTEPLARLYVLEMIARVQEELASSAPDRATTFLADANQAVLDVELVAAEAASPFPGAAEALGELIARGYRVAIVTRNARQVVERVLARHPIPHDLLFTRDDVPFVKPDPRHLQAALDVFGLRGAQAVMVGDHPMDVLVGKRALARTVGVLPPEAPPDYFAEAHPDLVVTHVGEILEYLGSSPRHSGIGGPG
jgi:phosphoglycolate phosphatase